VKYTGIILAGGMSRRMGREKATLKLGDKTIIEYVMETVGKVVDEILLITNKPEKYKSLGIPLFTDVLQANGALVGIHAGLVYSQTHYSLILACDMPFVKKGLLEYMFSKLQPQITTTDIQTEEQNDDYRKSARKSRLLPRWRAREPAIRNPQCRKSSVVGHRSSIDIVIPKSQNGLEPLCAIYSKRCIPEIESMVDSNTMKVSLLLNKFRTCFVSEDEFSSLDWEDSFFNINSEEDYKKALELFSKRENNVGTIPSVI
jgi:molybdopterin-guanine dinucleotide biosynthesis protein A